jgi:hypothetical protein
MCDQLVINLNVGGTTFSTTLSTLCSHPYSKLAAMFNQYIPIITRVDPNGSYFIDRNPKAFAVILDFLRTGKVFLDHAGVSAEQVRTEAEHFHLDSMYELLKKQPENIVTVVPDNGR